MIHQTFRKAYFIFMNIYGDIFSESGFGRFSVELFM